MKLIRFIFQNGKALVIGAALGGILSGGSAALIVALISQRLTGAKPWSVSFIMFFISLVVLVSGINLGGKWLVTKASARTTFKLRIQISGQILAASLRQLEEIGNPRLLASLTEDVLNVNTAINTLPVLSFNTAVVGGAMVYLAWLSPAVFLFLIIVGAPTVFGYQYLKQKARQELKTSIELRNRQFEAFQALTEGVKELKINRQRRGDFNQLILKPTVYALAEKNALISFLQEAANMWSLLIFFIFMMILFYLAANGVATTQVLTSFTVAVLFLRSSLVSVLTIIPAWDNAQVSLDNVESLGFSLDESNEKVAETSTKTTDHEGICLELRGVTHTYTQETIEDSFTLGPINLKLTSGELVFITGGNGSGKTTLIKLISSLYLPENGEIFLDGSRLNPGSLDAYRQLFSILFSDYYLFEQLLGLSGADLDARAADYLDKLQLNRKVKVVEGHFSTTNLSSGQRKRLALLTAYLEDRPVYIFDEWAAGQDPFFKEIFYRQILPDLKSRGKLLIVVSHDNTYYNTADRIIRLNNGRVEYDLSPQELTESVQ